jgi:sialic acid synthase SpsE
MNIGPLEIGYGCPVACIAEIGNAHNGDYGRAVRLLDAAKASGASAAKLQCYGVEELLALRGGDGPAPARWGDQGMSMRDLYTRAMTPREWFAPLYAHAASIGLPIFSSVFGPESMDLLESIGNPVWKIAALDSDPYNPFVDLVRKRLAGKPKIISTAQGWYNLDENAECLWLWAPPGYPQTSLELSRIDTENNYHGFSYHGTSIEPCIVAASRGAVVLEAHFMLWNEPSELEANVSLTEIQFGEMIRRVREVEAMLA